MTRQLHPIAEHRKSKQLTQAELAAALGTSKQYLAQVEGGFKVPSVPWAKMVEEKTGVSAAAVLLWEKPRASAGGR